MKIKDTLNERKLELEEEINDLLAEFAENTDLCVYTVKVFWRATSGGVHYPDVEVLISNQFRITPNPND